MQTTKNKTIHFKENGKNHVMQIEYGIRYRGEKNAYYTITGTLMEQVRSKSGVSKYGEDYKLIDGKYYKMYLAGCIHDEIKKRTDEFNDLIPLHLSNVYGIPMHAFANGFYHIENGFTDVPVNSEKFKDMFCEYYRIPLDVFPKLLSANNAEEYAIILIENNVVSKWLSESKSAIEKYSL